MFCPYCSRFSSKHRPGRSDSHSFSHQLQRKERKHLMCFQAGTIMRHYPSWTGDQKIEDYFIHRTLAKTTKWNKMPCKAPTGISHCGHDKHNSVYHTVAGKTSDLFISPGFLSAFCEKKGNFLSGQFLNAGVDTKISIGKQPDPTKFSYRIRCNGRCLRIISSFLPYMQTITLKGKISTGKFLGDSRRVLPCALEDSEWETSSLGAHAYMWDYSSNCFSSVLRTDAVNMAKEEGNVTSSGDKIQHLILC